MGIITFLEIYQFNIFSNVFNFIKDYLSWFIGLSFSTIFSNLFQNFSLFMASIFIKDQKNNEDKPKKDFFFIFLLSITIMAILSPFIKTIAVYFFNNFFVYFHIIFLQWMIFLYIFFKLKNKYEISGAYFLTNEMIVLIYTGVILYFVA